LHAGLVRQQPGNSRHSTQFSQPAKKELIMVSSIGSSSVASLMHRPDPSQMASKLFSKLDSKNQGYIEKSDLQSAFEQISGSSNSGNTASADEVFKQLDGNGDGKVTEQEMSDSLTKMAEQLDSQFNSMRTSRQGGMQGMGGMPPPPPQGADSAGLTKDQLTSMVSDTGSTDSKLTNLVNNFDKADTNGDGKVSAQEAMAFDRSSKSGSSSSTSADSGSTTSSSSSTNSEANVMMKIMQLMHAYGGLGTASSQSSSSGTLSTSA
jgi:Ca2+-binding EF-hand superfamily protein